MGRTRSDGIETRGRLLNAAVEIFAVKGYRDATVAEICLRAVANVAAVNYHFGGKEALYAQAWHHAFEQSIAAHPPDGGVPSSAPAGERLRGQVLSIISRILDPRSMEFDIAHKEMANPTGLLGEVMRRSIEPMRRLLTDTVSELLGPAATPVRVRFCEMSIHSQCFGPLMRERHHRSSPRGLPGGPPRLAAVDAAAFAEHVVRFSLAGIREIGRSMAEEGGAECRAKSR